MTRIATLVLLLLASCASPVDESRREDESPAQAPPVSTPAPRVAVATDRSSYTFTEGPQGPEATIVATLRAPADRALYIVNCNGASSVTLHRKRGEEWVLAWAPTINGCLSAPIVVPGGSAHTARVYLHERSGAVIDPQGGRTIESGIYRVAWSGVLTSFDANAPGFGPELPIEERVSAPITIQAAARRAP